MRRFTLPILLMSLLLLRVPTALGASIDVPDLLDLQGYIRTNIGDPYSGTVQLELRLYDAITGGTLLYSETLPAVPVVGSRFSVLVGGITPLPPNLFSSNATIFLALVVDGGPELPRATLATVPFAFHARRALGADTSDVALSLSCPGCISDPQIADAGVSELKLAFDTATQAELNAHKTSGDHDARYVNVAGDTMTGELKIGSTQSGTLLLDSLAPVPAGSIAGRIGFSGHGTQHGQIAWAPGAGFILCDASAATPTTDFGATCNRVSLRVGGLDISGGLSCPGCIDPADVGFNYAGSSSQGGAALDLACTNCVSPAEVGFGYAASATKGGAAADLACTSCVQATEIGVGQVNSAHIQDGGISQVDVAFKYAGSASKGGPATQALDLACTGCVQATEVAFNYAGSATQGGDALGLTCAGCVALTELGFDTATQAELDAHKTSADHDSRYVNLSGDVMTGNLTMSDRELLGVNGIAISDPGPGEGLRFGGTAAGWTIDVSPSDRSNQDGDLNFYGTAGVIRAWRPIEARAGITLVGGTFDCPGCIGSTDVSFNYAGSTSPGGAASDLACTNCVAAAEVGFAYAGSATKGGAALDLACSNCVGSTDLAPNSVSSAHIQNGSISSVDVGFNYAGSASKGGAAADLACANCVASTEVGFNYAGSGTKGGAATSSLDLQCSGCVALAELGFDPATQAELNAHKTSADHDGRYVNRAGDTMTGTLDMANQSIDGANRLNFADPGPAEGLRWMGTAGNWMIDVSPLDRTNADGDLNLYGLAGVIRAWRPIEARMGITLVGGTFDCPGCIGAADVGFNYAGSATQGGPAADLACTNCVAPAEVGFNYAGSLSKGGAATGLACTDCVGSVDLAPSSVASGHIQDGSVSSVDVGFNYAGSASKGGAAADLACTNCVASAEVAFNYAGSAAKGGPATSALDLACVGCVALAELGFDTATQAELDAHAASAAHDGRYVNITGDTMTGNLHLANGKRLVFDTNGGIDLWGDGLRLWDKGDFTWVSGGAGLNRMSMNLRDTAILFGRGDTISGTFVQTVAIQANGDLICNGCIDPSDTSFNFAGSASQGGAASDLACTNCVATTEVGFNYAGSNAKGGAALDLSCTDCVGAADLAPNAVASGHIQDGGVAPADVSFNYAGSTSKGGAASDLTCTNCVATTEVAFNYAGSGSKGGAANQALDLNCVACVSASELDFTVATSGDLAAHKISGDHDARYVLKAGDTMTGHLHMGNKNIDQVNALVIFDPGTGEGIQWAGTAAGWTIDVTPVNRSNLDGDLNLYGTAGTIRAWRPLEARMGIQVPLGQDLTCVDCVHPTDVAFGYAGSGTKGGAATSALDLQCTACVTTAELGFDTATQAELDAHIASGGHDARYVNISGDTMTGQLTLGNNTNGILELGSPSPAASGQPAGRIGFAGWGAQHGQIAWVPGQGFLLCNSSTGGPSGDYGANCTRVPLRAASLDLTGGLSCPGCVGSTDVGFNYAASTTKGGAASDLACTNCVAPAEVGFNYAASNAKGGAALDLTCTNCVGSADLAPNAVTSGHIQDGAVAPADVSFNYAGSASKGGAAADLACTNCVASAEVGFNYAGSGSKGGAANQALDLNCVACVSASELDFTVVTSADLATHIASGDHDPRYVNVSGDTMAGHLALANWNLNSVNILAINDPGAGEGVVWNGTAAGWRIDVSPENRTNQDGDLNLYGTAGFIRAWRPIDAMAGIQIRAGQDLSCPGCINPSDVSFGYAGSATKGGAASDLACTNCVAAAEVGFNYAGSTSKGGAANNLVCTDCVGASDLAPNSVASGHIQNGSVGSVDVGFNYAGSASKGGAATDLACTSCVSPAELSFDPATQAELNAHKTSGDHDGRYVNVTGDTMTGTLQMAAQLRLQRGQQLWFDGADSDWGRLAEVTAPNDNQYELRLTLSDDRSDQERFTVYSEWWNGGALRMEHRFTAAGNAYHRNDLQVGRNITLGGDLRGPVGGGAVRIRSNSGYVDVGSQSASWAHIQTDRPRFYLNKGLTVDTGLIGSYAQDLQLQTSGTTRITVNNSNGYVGLGVAAVSPLHLKSTSGDMFRLESGGSEADIHYIGPTGVGWEVGTGWGGNPLGKSAFYLHSGGGRLMVGNTGTVYIPGSTGLGTPSPAEKLHVVGNARVDGNLIVNGEILSNGGQIRNIIPVFGNEEGAALINSPGKWQTVSKTMYSYGTALPQAPGTVRETYLVIREGNSFSSVGGCAYRGDGRFWFSWANKPGHVFVIGADWGSPDEGKTQWIKVPSIGSQVAAAGAAPGYWRLEMRVPASCGGHIMKVYEVKLVEIDRRGGSAPAVTLGSATAPRAATVFKVGGIGGNAISVSGLSVGIGNVAPTAMLDVSGDLYVERGGMRFNDSWGGLPSIEVTGGSELRIHKAAGSATLRVDGGLITGAANTLGGDTTVGGNLTVNGFSLTHNGGDFVMRYAPRGSGGRAMVHAGGNVLSLNYAGDFTGGVNIQGSKVQLPAGSNGLVCAGCVDQSDISFPVLTQATLDAHKVSGDHDGRYVNVTGDTMTGGLIVRTNADNPLRFENTDNSWQYIEFTRSGARKTYMGLTSGNEFRIQKEGGGSITLSGGPILLNGDVRGSGAGGSLRINRGSGYLDIGPQNNGWAHYVTDRGSHYFNTRITVDTGQLSSYSQDLQLMTAGTERVRIMKANGRVGIGTASPSNKLHVVGDARITGDTYFGPSGVLRIDQGGSIELGRSTPGASTPYVDFHYGVGTFQDFNVRLINDANGQLSLIGNGRVTGRMDVGGDLRVGGVYATLRSDNAHMFCGPNGNCATTSNIVAGRIQLSADGGFANAQACDPGMGGICATILYDRNNTAYYANPASTSYFNDMRANIYYDRNNTGFYADPASTSVFNILRADILYDRNNTAYYADPASQSRFNDLRANIFYDLNNTAFRADPNGTSYFNDMRADIYYDRNNTAYYANPASTSYFNDLRMNIIYDRQNTGYYVDPNGTTHLNKLIVDQSVQEAKFGGTVVAGRWYRIASNPGDRANAEFTLRELTQHSQLTFRAGISYGNANGMSFTVLNHSTYPTAPAFTQVRMLHRGIYDPVYLEVYVAQSGAVDFSVHDNSFSSGWTPVAWALGGVPGGYTARVYATDRLFVVSDYADRFTVARGGNVGIGTATPGQKLQVVGNVMADRYYDRNNSAYYSDPASTSYFNDMRANIYYDRQNTTYYMDPQSVSNFNEVRAVTGRMNIYYDRNNAAYYADPASTSQFNDMRASIYYDRDNTSYYANPASTSYFNDFRMNIIYDRNNTAYYLNPNSSSRLNELYVDGWFRNNYTGRGLYNQQTGRHFYSQDTNYWVMTAGRGLMIRDDYGSTVRGYLYTDGGSNFGLLTKDGNWQVRAWNTGVELYDTTYAASVQANIYYDRNNTAYYADPASTSYFNDMRANIFYDRNNTAFRADPNGTSYFNDMRADIYYDRNNTAYYANPASTSYFNDLRMNIIYDRQNSGYYVDPNGTTHLSKLIVDQPIQESLYSGNVVAGRWYRIALNTGSRAGAEFTLRDFISGGGHSQLTFRLGAAYNDAGGMSFTLLNHHRYSTATFTKVRILHASTYAQMYVEVYAARTGSVNFSIRDNLQSAGWAPVAWGAGSVPAGYTQRVYDVDRLFVVADYANRLTVTRGGNVGIGTSSPGQRLQVVGNVMADRYYDRNNSAYYSDPASTSYFNDMRANIYYDRNNTAYYANPASTSYFNDFRMNIIYDRQNTGYYLDPNGTSRVYKIGFNGCNSINCGLYVWSTGDNNHVIYSANPGGAPGGLAGYWDAGHRLRNRTSTGQGFLWENSANQAVMDLDSDDGRLWTRGEVRLGNSDIYFTKTNHNHSGIGNTSGWAAIENAANYNTLMIMGRSGTAVGRSVSIWDYLTVNGSQTITGTLTVNDIKPDRLISKSYGHVVSLNERGGIGFTPGRSGNGWNGRVNTGDTCADRGQKKWVMTRGGAPNTCTGSGRWGNDRDAITLRAGVDTWGSGCGDAHGMSVWQVDGGEVIDTVIFAENDSNDWAVGVGGGGWRSFGNSGGYDNAFDMAEFFLTPDVSTGAGEIVIISSDPDLDAQQSGRVEVVRSERAYQRSAIGVVSTQPNMYIAGAFSVTGSSTLLTKRQIMEDGEHYLALLSAWSNPRQAEAWTPFYARMAAGEAVPVALVGRVPVKVTGEGGPIRPGDLVTTSSLPGHGMKATRPGPTIGVAMTAFEGRGPTDTGAVVVFLSRQDTTTPDRQTAPSREAPAVRNDSERPDRLTGGSAPATGTVAPPVPGGGAVAPGGTVVPGGEARVYALEQQLGLLRKQLADRDKAIRELTGRLGELENQMGSGLFAPRRETGSAAPAPAEADAGRARAARLEREVGDLRSRLAEMGAQMRSVATLLDRLGLQPATRGSRGTEGVSGSPAEQGDEGNSDSERGAGGGTPPDPSDPPAPEIPATPGPLNE